VVCVERFVIDPVQKGRCTACGAGGAARLRYPRGDLDSRGASRDSNTVF